MPTAETALDETQVTPWLKDFIFTWVSRFGIFLAHHVTRPLLPLYLITFGASSTVIGAVMAVFTITAIVMRVPVGLYIDRLGRKPFLLYGIVLFGAGNLGYWCASSLLLILPCRILHGLGWSGCTTAVSTISADTVPAARRGDLMGYAGVASTVAAALGPVLGFALFHRFAYAGVFLGAGVLLLVSLFSAIPVTEPKLTKAPAGNATRFLDTIMVKEALNPAINVAFLSFGHGGILTFLAIQALKIGLANPGIWFGGYALAILISRPIAGPISDRIRRPAAIIPGVNLNLAGILMLAFATTPTLLIAAAIIAGLGTGAAQPALMTLVIDQSGPTRRGQSLAQFQFFYDLGIGVGSLTLGALLDLVNQSFLIMYLATAAVALVGLCFMWQRK